jgi:hypothetical protein
MRRHSRAALTLVEMLVAMAVTLIMMGAVVTLFGNIGSSISGSRAVMEISERLRNARNVLQTDLKNVTVTMLPPRRPENDEGYFEYTEGPQSDLNPINPDTATGSPAWLSLLGDSDDILRMTVRSRGEPFVGRYSGGTITSQTAEVVWFVGESTDAPILDVSALHGSGPLNGQPRRLKTLYRRIFLIAPSISTAPAAGDEVSYSNSKANTLGDLTKRENRFTNTGTFPFPIDYATLVPVSGNDIILTNVLAFDVKAFDPTVPVLLSTTGVATLPSDPGYSGNNVAGIGGYVDLNYANSNSSIFSGPPQAKSGIVPLSAAMPPVYDTWSLHYEQNGIDENGDGVVDGATNGLDDDNNGIVDDSAEADAPPPYPVPLRGIQAKIRVYEPDSRQVREVTVVQDFLPQ